MGFEILTTTVSASVLAVATTIHLAAVLLRAHNNPVGRKYDLLLLPGVIMAGTPWLLPTVAGLAAGGILHAAWLFACARLVPEPAPAPSVSTAARTGSGLSVPPVAAARPAPAPSASPWAKTPVIAVVRETPDIMTFRLARPDDFEFEAGQFLTLRMTADGNTVSRCYSVSSAPESTGYVEISVKRQGLVSGLLHATIRPGSMLEILRPAGTFVYPAGDQRPLTLIAGGVGITPLMSMLRHAVQADPTRPVTLLYSVNQQGDIAFRQELLWLAARYLQVKIVVTTTVGPHSSEYLSGYIDREMLVEQVPDLEQNIFMICGPQPMMDAMKSILAGLGVESSQIRSEVFSAAVALAEAAGSEDLSQTDQTEPSAGGEPFELHLVTSGHTLPANPGKTLLEACEEAGVDLPSACRAGVCGTCRARLVEGRVEGEGSCLNDADRADGYILPCVARPATDCAMEA